MHQKPVFWYQFFVPDETGSKISGLIFLYYGVEHCSTPYQISVPEKIDTDSHDTPAENWYRFSGTGFRYRFLVHVSLALINVYLFKNNSRHSLNASDECRWIKQTFLWHSGTRLVHLTSNTIKYKLNHFVQSILVLVLVRLSNFCTPVANVAYGPPDVI